MKVVCSICGYEEEVSEGILKELSEFRNKYDLKAISYIRMLNMIRGKCLNSDEHSFEFDEEFMATIKDIVAKEKADRETAERLMNENSNLLRETEAMEIKIKENKLKTELNNQKINSLGSDRNIFLQQIKNLTGANDIWIWY